MMVTCEPPTGPLIINAPPPRRGRAAGGPLGIGALRLAEAPLPRRGDDIYSAQWWHLRVQPTAGVNDLAD